MQPKKTGRTQTGVSIFIGITNSRFSRIHRSMHAYDPLSEEHQISVEVPAYNRKLHSKVKVNHASRFRYTSDQSSSFFLLLFAQTQKSL